ncbi:hypothetical protein DM860_018007 [Cuscuta australis]|uniref:Uncharacterized protein n=1 Tax=Cuscuta australis TaxID=267555 RepID=A0A328D474_9ASTE|nr:hypothetical protein DM860_018007 [Cuscuta australis]
MKGVFHSRCVLWRLASAILAIQIWNHPWILQIMKENIDATKLEDTVENFIVEDCSSDENRDNIDIPSGAF